MDRILLDGKPIVFQNNVFFTEKNVGYLKERLVASDIKIIAYFDDLNLPNEKVITLINKNMKNKVFLENNFASYFQYFHKKLSDIPPQLAAELIFLSICSSNEKVFIIISDVDYQNISRETLSRYKEHYSFIIYRHLYKKTNLPLVEEKKPQEISPDSPKQQVYDYLFLFFILLFAMASGVLAGSFMPAQRLNNIATFLQNVHEENNSSFEVLQYNVEKAKYWATDKYPEMTDAVNKFEGDFAATEAVVFLSFESSENISPINVDFTDISDMSQQYGFLGVSSREYLGLTLIAQSTNDYVFTNEISVPQVYADYMINSLGYVAGDYASLLGLEINSKSQYGGVFSEEKLIVNSVFEENPAYLTYKKIVGNDFFVGSLTKYYPSLPRMDIQINNFSTENIRRVFNYIEKYFVIEKDFLLSYALYAYTISLLEETGNTYETGDNNTKLAAIILFYNSSYHIAYLLVFSISFILCNYLVITIFLRMIKTNKRLILLFLPIFSSFILLVISILVVKSVTIFSSPIYINNFYGETLLLLNFLFLLFWTFFKIIDTKGGLNKKSFLN